MDFSIRDVIEFPVEDVFIAHRDHLVDLVDYLPNIEQIEVKSRQEKEGKIQLVNVWKAASTEVPGILRPFVRPEMMKWTDEATWCQSSYTCEYRIEFGFLNEAIHCSGINLMKPVDNKSTEVILEGTISIDARKVPGVPKLMARKIGATVETFVVKLITPNLRRTNDGVRQFLRDGHQDKEAS